MTLPGWVGVREPRGRLRGLYAKNVTICPTQACTIPPSIFSKVSKVAGAQNSSGRGFMFVVSRKFKLPLPLSPVRCYGTQVLRPLSGLRCDFVPRVPRTSSLPCSWSTAVVQRAVVRATVRFSTLRGRSRGALVLSCRTLAQNVHHAEQRHVHSWH